MQAEKPQPPMSPTASQSPPPTDGQLQVGMSASQMGVDQPKNKLFDFNPKKLMIRGLVGLILLGAIFAVLVATNIVPLRELKTINYTNSKGVHYTLKFYAKHSSKQLASGNTQLVSKVSKDDKFPVVLSITTGDASSYARVKDCANFTKVFDVQNDNLNQKISVCDAGKQTKSQNASGGVYVAGFMHNDQANIISIGQDYSDIDLSSQSGAQQSLAKFGLDVYADDIKIIVSSIKLE